MWSGASYHTMKVVMHTLGELRLDPKPPAGPAAQRTIRDAVARGSPDKLRALATQWEFAPAECAHLLKSAAAGNRLDLIQLLISIYESNGVCTCAGRDGALRVAANANYYPIVQWALRGEARPALRTLQAAVFQACAGGHVVLAAWVLDTWPLMPAELRDDRGNTPLAAACSGGHTPAARWLTTRLGLTAADARADGNYALAVACANGHSDTALWLIDTFSLTLDDVSSRRFAALRWAHRDGAHETMRVVMHRFALLVGNAPPVEVLRQYCGEIDSDYGDNSECDEAEP